MAGRYTEVVEASSDFEMSSPQIASPRRIVLTGFMGSGKSTVGPLVAARLGWRFLDVDDVIEAEAGVAIAEIFARHGEAHFRELERATIARLAADGALVLALGGGAIEHAGHPRAAAHSALARCWFIWRWNWPPRWPAAEAPSTRGPYLPTRPTWPAATSAAFRSTARPTSRFRWTR